MSYVYGFMNLDYDLGTMTTTTYSLIRCRNLHKLGAGSTEKDFFSVFVFVLVHVLKLAV